MNKQQAAQAIALYQQGNGYKTIARVLGFKSATSIRRVITRAGLNETSRACTAPDTRHHQQERRQQYLAARLKECSNGTQGAQKDYSTDPVLLGDAQLFAQRQTARMFNAITDMGFVLEHMPMLEVGRLDPKYWSPWEDVDLGRMTDEEADRLLLIAKSEAGLFEVCANDTSGDCMETLGYFERPQIIDLITGKQPVDELRTQAIQHAIRDAVINNTVKHAPEGFDHEAARLSGEIQKAQSSLRFSGFALGFASSMAGVKPSQDMIDKNNQEKQELQDKLTGLQAQWSSRYGVDYERFIEKPEQLLLTG